MTEIEKMLGKENAEKKRIARGARNKKRGGGRYVRTPSDYLTKKEREAMNGEVISFDPRKFYTWQEFKALPDEYQLKYVNSLINRYDVGVSNISVEVFGLSKYGLTNHLTAKGLYQYVNRGGDPHDSKRTVAGRKKLAADIQAARNPKPEETEASDSGYVKVSPAEFFNLVPAEEPETASEAAEEIAVENAQPVVETAAQPSYDGLTALIAALRGTGAKITIAVTL